MKYFKATYKVKNKTTEPYIGEDGKISWEAPDSDGDYYGHAEDLPSVQSIHNVTSEDIHSVVVIEITADEYVAAGYTV